MAGRIWPVCSYRIMTLFQNKNGRCCSCHIASFTSYLDFSFPKTLAEIVLSTQIQKLAIKVDEKSAWFSHHDAKYSSLGEMIFFLRDYFTLPLVSSDYIRSRREKIYTFGSYDVLNSQDLVLSEDETAISSLRGVDELSKCLLNYVSLKDVGKVDLILKFPGITPNIVDRDTGKSKLYFRYISYSKIYKKETLHSISPQSTMMPPQCKNSSPKEPILPHSIGMEQRLSIALKDQKTQ